MSTAGRTPWRSTLAVTAVLAVLCCGWFGYSWWSAAHSEPVQRGAARDSALEAGIAALDTLHTVDHTTAERSVDAWLFVATGQLAEGFRDDRERHVRRTKKSRVSATASVAGAALANLDRHAGTARMLAVVEVDITTKAGPAKPRRSSLAATLKRTTDGWKLSSVEPIR